MAKPRVHELAKEFGVESKFVLEKLKEMGEFVKSASSTVEPPVAMKFKKEYGEQLKASADTTAAPAPEKKASARPGPKPGPKAEPAPAAVVEAPETGAPTQAPSVETPAAPAAEEAPAAPAAATAAPARPGPKPGPKPAAKAAPAQPEAPETGGRREAQPVGFAARWPGSGGSWCGFRGYADPCWGKKRTSCSRSISTTQMNRSGADGAAAGAMLLASLCPSTAAGHGIGSALGPVIPLGPVGLPFAGPGVGVAFVHARFRRT